MPNRAAVLLLGVIVVVVIFVVMNMSNGQPPVIAPSPVDNTDIVPPVTNTPPPTAAPQNRYYLGKGCPAGWQDKGVLGVIMRNEDYPKNPLSPGGGFNEGWTWAHANVCYGNKNSGVNGLYKFGAQDPSKGPIVGLIMQNEQYPKNPFGPGGGFNEGWTWSHPSLVPASSPGGYSFNISGGGVGPMGVIMHNGDLNTKNVFPKGGGFNPDWTWTHPNIEPDA